MIMKTILQYGQAVRNRKKQPSLLAAVDVFQSAVNAMQDGYNLRDYERVVTKTGFTIIRKRKGSI